MFYSLRQHIYTGTSKVYTRFPLHQISTLDYVTNKCSTYRRQCFLQATFAVYISLDCCLIEQTFSLFLHYIKQDLAVTPWKPVTYCLVLKPRTLCLVRSGSFGNFFFAYFSYPKNNHMLILMLIIITFLGEKYFFKCNIAYKIKHNRFLKMQ